MSLLKFLGFSVAIGVALRMAAGEKPKGHQVAGEETITEYRGYGIAISLVDSEIAKPWRWRILDGDGEPVANATDWEATEAGALGRGKAWVDEHSPKAPDVPGGPEGDAGPPPAACEEVVPDGDLSICLYRAGGGWSYRATDAGGLPVATAGPYDTRGGAKVAAWRATAQAHPTTVVGVPTTRHGLTLSPDGSIKLDKLQTWTSFATPIFAQAIGANAAPLATITNALGKVFPAVNPWRFKPNGKSLQAAALRVAGVNDPQKAARDVFGPYSVGANTSG